MLLKGILVFIGIIILAAIICQGLFLIDKHFVKGE